MWHYWHRLSNETTEMMGAQLRKQTGAAKLENDLPIVLQMCTPVAPQ